MFGVVGRYVKRPLVVEAIQLSRETWERVHDFLGVVMRDLDGEVCIFISTLEGVMKASDGDWVIRGLRGEFYPCKPDIFEATYEEVSDTTNHGLKSIPYGRIATCGSGERL